MLTEHQGLRLQCSLEKNQDKPQVDQIGFLAFGDCSSDAS
jgi:hypothetical protein